MRHRTLSLLAAALIASLACSGSERSAAPAPESAAPANDGAGAFVATLLRAGSSNDFPFGGTISPFYWVTRSDFVSCDFAAAIDDAPGDGNRWTFTAEWAPLAAEKGCDAIPHWTEAPLCSIDGANRSCTAKGVPIAIRGPACLRGRAVIAPGDNRGRHAGQGSGGTASFHCHDASGDGPSHFQGTGQTKLSGGMLHAGAVVRSPNHDRAHWINTGGPLARCSGVIALPAPPAGGETWRVRLAASTGPLAPGSNCLDLSYTTTAELCTIEGGERSCDFPPTAVAVPTGGCLQMRVACTGGACEPRAVLPQYGLDCSSSAEGRFDGGGPRYESAGSGAFDAAHEFGTGPWGVGDANFASLQYGQAYWIAPPSGLARCGGGFTFQQAISGTGQVDVGLRVASGPLEPGQSCLDADYEDTGTLCSIAAGSKSCWFPLTAAPVPPGACFALHARSSGGTPVAGPDNNFSWQATCAAD